MSWPKRLFWTALLLLVVVGVSLLALRIFITTSSGARYIENQLNKRSFGAIESIEVSGLSGDPLKAFSIENLVVKDKEGVWLRAHNLDLKWKPFAYFKDHIWIENLAIEKTDILRRPHFNVTAGGKDPRKTTFEKFNFAKIDLDENLIGQALSVDASGAFIVQPGGAITAKVKSSRLDVAGDTLVVDFTRSENRDMTGVFDVKGAADGPIARLFKAPEGTNVVGTGTLSGTDVNGEGHVVIAFGDTQNVSANTLWTAEKFDATATFNLEDWPAFDQLRQRLGTNLQSKLHVDRQAGAQPFTANLNVPGLTVDADGFLPDGGLVPTRANIDARADKVTDFISLPDGYAATQGTAKGQIVFAKPFGFTGQITLANITTPQGSAKLVAGPLEVTQTQKERFAFKTDFVLTDLVTRADIPVDLDTKTKFKSTGNLDMEKDRVIFDTYNLVSGNNQIAGKGSLSTNGQSLDVTGKGSAAIKSRGSIPAGIVKADFALLKTSGSGLSITTDGAFRPDMPLAEPLGGLVGEQLVFKAMMNPIEGGVNLSSASLIGDHARAALTGTLGEQLNVSGEFMLSAPLDYKSVTIDSGTEGSFALAGSRTAPALRLDTQAGSVRVQNYVLNNARLRAEITDIFNAPQGPVQIEADTAYGPLTASSQFASTPGVYIANQVDVNWGRVTLGGDLRYTQDGVATGEINLRLPERDGQYARAGLTLSNVSGEQGVALNIDAKQIAYSGFQFDTLNAKASGTLASLSGTLKGEGQRGYDLIARRFEIDAPFTLSRNKDQTYTASLSLEGRYGEIGLTSQAPIIATYTAGEVSIIAPLLIADGRVDVNYQRGTAREQLKLSAASLPVTLIPMPGNLADTRGRIDAEIDMTAEAGRPLQGGGTVTLKDWRGFDVAKGEGLTGDLTLNINGFDADLSLTAGSPAGFKTDGKLRVALLSAPSLSDTRLNMRAPISGAFSASGAASSVFGLVTPSDAELGGELSAKLAIAGTAANPKIEGQAGGSDIRFEIPEIGTRIRQGRFTANFTNDTFTLSDLYVADADEGSLTGSGDFKLGELGRPLGKLDIRADRFRVLDRSDVDAKVNGTLNLISEPKNTVLAGDISIDTAEVKQFVSGSVSVIEIDVEEINRPNQIDTISFKKPSTPIELDVRIRAPRKIFVRSRGLDVEMSADATIKGTLTEPLFYGEAKVLRGGYKLSGKTLDFEDGTITFDGDLAKAKIEFKAVTETQNLTATVKITGTVEAPEIALSSSPERPQDEILSALLFGRSATEISGLEAAQLAGALAQLSGKGGGIDLLGGLRDAFGIGQLSVNFNEDGSAQLVGGRYLAKNVYLQIFSGAGPDQNGAIIDWEIRKNLSLRSLIRADNDQTLSLKWKRDF